MLRCSLFLLISTAPFFLANGLDCNICGPGTKNFMLEPKGVVTIDYDGAERKQNCDGWQKSQLISEEWCEANMLRYTYLICKCAQTDGTLLKDTYTIAPATATEETDQPAADTASTQGEYRPPADNQGQQEEEEDFCNICGPGTENLIGAPNYYVTVNYQGEDIRDTCDNWQTTTKLQLAKQWCEDNILSYTSFPCRCKTPEGVFLSEPKEGNTTKPTEDEEDKKESIIDQLTADTTILIIACVIVGCIVLTCLCIICTFCGRRK